MAKRVLQESRAKTLITISTSSLWFGLGLAAGHLPKPFPTYASRAYLVWACLIAGWYAAGVILSPKKG